MSLQIHFSKRNFSKNLSSIIGILSDNLIGQFVNDDSIIDPEAHIVLKNPEDRIIVDNAVQEMKNNRNINRKTITLSNDKTVTLSID